MSSAWRTVFTYGVHHLFLTFADEGLLYSYNKYAQITARAVRMSLKEEKRLAAEKRGVTTLRYQQWENGKGGQQVMIFSLKCLVSKSVLQPIRLLYQKKPETRLHRLLHYRQSIGPFHPLLVHYIWNQFVLHYNTKKKTAQQLCLISVLLLNS